MYFSFYMYFAFVLLYAFISKIHLEIKKKRKVKFFFTYLPTLIIFKI